MIEDSIVDIKQGGLLQAGSTAAFFGLGNLNKQTWPCRLAGQDLINLSGNFRNFGTYNVV
jgi:hypothetical protein